MELPSTKEHAGQPAPLSLSALRDRVTGADRALAFDVLFVAAAAAVALILRLYDLGGIPDGFHGDEGATGIDARRILDGQDIFPYTDAAWGQPSGPMYWAAVWVKLLGVHDYSVRVPMALLGAGTVVLGFFAFRELFGRSVAWMAAVLFVFSSWLLIYNRSGYTVSAMPFTEMAALLAVGIALRRQTWRSYIIAGVVAGLGIYGYFSYPLFAVGLAVWVVVHALIEQPRPLLLHARKVAVMGLVALLMTQPMWPYFDEDGPGFRRDRKPFSVGASQAYKDADGWEKVEVYWDNAHRVFGALYEDDHPDGSDGSGTVSAMDPLLLALAAAGCVLCVVRAWTRRNAAYLLPFIIIPLIMAGPIASIGSQQRRSLGILPFVVLPAAVALAFAWDVLRTRASTIVAVGAVGTLLSLYAAINIDRYFDTTNNAGIYNFAFSQQNERVARFLNDQSGDTHIYFASDKLSAGYETLRYLVTDRTVNDGTLEDRSEEFSRTTGYDNLDRTRTSLIVLMYKYIEDAPDIERAYPDAERIEGPTVGGAPSYVAYRIPPEPD